MLGVITGTRNARWIAAATLCAALALPAAASARKPVVSYVDAGGSFRLYDLELGMELPPPPVPVPPGFAQFRWGMSLDGRYIVFNDAERRLHLLDRATGTEVPLPGIDIDADADGTVDANPGSLSVSDTGLIAFDANGNGPARVYDANAKAFVDTGLGADNGHRQTKLSGDGRFLATTCGPAAGCIVDLGTDSNPYVQDLQTKQDTGFPDTADRDEEHPCIDGDGSLVGIDRQHPNATSPRDVFVFDRALSPPAPLSLAGLNDPAKEDSYCVLDAGGDHVGLLFDNSAFKVYERASGTFLTLPPGKEFSERSTFSAPYSPPVADGGSGPPPLVDARPPTVRRFELTRRRFAVGRRATPRLARRLRRGTAFRFRLSEAATVRIALARRAAGRRAGGRCRPPARRWRKRRRCVRYVRAGTLVRRGLGAGANRVAFSGRVGRRALRPGRYRATLRAVDAAGNRSRARRVTFTVVRR